MNNNIPVIILAIVATTAFFVIRNYLRSKKRGSIINDINNSMSIDEIIKKYDIDEIQRTYKFDTIATPAEITEQFKLSFGKTNPRFNNGDPKSIELESVSLGLISNEITSNNRYKIDKVHFENNNILFVASFNTRTDSVYSDMVEVVNVIVIANIDTSVRKRIDFYAVPIENSLKYQNILKEFMSSIIVFMQTNNIVK